MWNISVVFTMRLVALLTLVTLGLTSPAASGIQRVPTRNEVQLAAPSGSAGVIVGAHMSPLVQWHEPLPRAPGEIVETRYIPVQQHHSLEASGPGFWFFRISRGTAYTLRSDYGKNRHSEESRAAPDLLIQQEGGQR